MTAHPCARRLARRSTPALVLTAVAVLLVQTLLVWNFSSLDSAGGDGGARSRGTREERHTLAEEAVGRRARSADPLRPLGRAAVRLKLRADVHRSHHPKEKLDIIENSVRDFASVDSNGNLGARQHQRVPLASVKRKLVAVQSMLGKSAQEVLERRENRSRTHLDSPTSPAPPPGSVRTSLWRGNTTAATPSQCEINGKEVISALSRAKSSECRQKIVDVYCRHKDKKLMPEKVPRYCPSQGKAGAPLHWDEGLVGGASAAPVRLVFVLVVHGRASRQLRRLFKAVYHTSHYYLVHVDQRSDYLQREVEVLARRYANVRVTAWREATIWGGASLLQMYLRSMEELLLADWSWDFFINLSSADYPVRTNEQLVNFLSKHRNMNFIKSHGRDNSRFIRKQGLDRLFLECDAHMWRLGDRKIPEGITVDGGSDWFLLSREFVQYVVTSRDDLVTQMKRFYKHTLLPAESFFHTVLENSALCRTMLDNNLRLTNWNRKLGCKCQYKHIVDWCGCSPNDFTAADLPRLQQASRPTFFARKFEASVSQTIINQLDWHLFGAPPPDTPGLSAYWENIYEHDTDGSDALSDSALTHFHAFTRMGLNFVLLQGPHKDPHCRLVPTGHPQSVHVYFLSDQFRGYLVRHVTTNQESGQQEALETWVTRQDHFTLASPPHPNNRLLHVQVGADWDPKERLFRNWGGLLGPRDEPVAVQRWSRGQNNLTATVVWIDPTNVIAATYDILVDAAAEVTHYRPPLNPPLRPGRWTLRVLQHWSLLGQTSFVVAPLEVHQWRALQREEALRLNGGPPRNSYMEQSFHGLNPVLRLPVSLRAVEEAEVNAGLTGAPLRLWINRLLDGAWSAADVCSMGPSVCPGLETCRETVWSSVSPDPKSELSMPRANGRIR